MSWNASGKAIVDYDSVSVHLDINNPQKGYGEHESEQAIRQCMSVLKSLLRGYGPLHPLDGAFPLGTGQFTIALAGHSNPNNVPESGWANDYLTIHISKEK